MKTLDCFRLDHSRIIVTGAAGLLGQEFSAALLEAGATVHMLDASEERLDRSLAWLDADLRAQALPVICDLTSKDAVRKAVAEIGSNGPIHGLVNSAAIDPKFETDAAGNYVDDGSFATYGLANWARSLEVNLTGTFLISQAVCAEMEKSGHGSVVNVSSIYGLTGPDQRIYARADGEKQFWKPVDYSTTKAGILGFTRALAAAYMGTNIRVNALTPGGTFNHQSDEFVRNYSDRTILGRMANPNEFRAAIIFLCSSASSYMTGANLVIDGGWSAM